MSNTKSKMTFGNILLSILLLGTLIVIGLIVLVYFQLTDPSQRTTNSQIQNTSTQPPQTVSILLPDGSEKERRVVDPNHQSASQTTTPASATINQDADNIANNLKNDQSDQLNNRALTGGNIYTPRRPRPKPRHDNTASNTNNTSNNYRSYNRNSYTNHGNNKGEVPIEPNNTHERTLQPKNSHQNSNTGEQPLMPIKPKKQSESIDALF